MFSLSTFVSSAQIHSNNCSTITAFCHQGLVQQVSSGCRTSRTQFHPTHFCQRLSRPKGHSENRRIRPIKKSNGYIGYRTLDLSACSIVPQQLCYRVLYYIWRFSYYTNKKELSYCCYYLLCVSTFIITGITTGYVCILHFSYINEKLNFSQKYY